MVTGNPWRCVLVEDNEQERRDVLDFLQGEDFSFGSLEVSDLSSFEEALPLLSQRKVDLLILDVMGDKGEEAGVEVLEKWRSAGFSPVIFYTAIPENVQEHSSPLVKVVGKDVGGLSQLGEAIKNFFELKIPQTHRAITVHFDSALRSYMWGFVQENWPKLQGLVDRPDFVRLLLRRLAAQFSREDVERVVESVYPGTLAGVSANQEGLVHPTEYYIKPPINLDPQLGDIRRVDGQLFVVVWPSCDLVFRKDTCKVERALCAQALPLSESQEYKDWSASKSESKRDPLVKLMSNNRQKGQAERYHFLPGAWDLPVSIIDFQALQHFEVSRLKDAEHLATLASPFAESVGTRFVRYLGRLGTPDLDIQACLNDIDNTRSN